MNITFRQLKLFLALADTGSVSRAAQACHVTQPTASMQLKEVSDSVGLPLYEVIAKRVHLTDAGRDLARTARAIQDEWAAFEQRIDATQGLTRGQLRVAVVSTAKYFVPRLLGSFCAQYPEIDIALEVLNRDGVVQRLRDNRDDLYIMSMPPADMDLEDQVFLPNPLVVIAAQSHPLASQGPLTLQDLSAQRFILRERGSGTRMAVDAHFKRQRFKPQLRLELGSNEAVKEAVAGDLGLSVLSRHALAGQPAAHGVAVLDVQGFPLASSWHLVRQKGKQWTPIARVFQAHLLARSAGWAPPLGTESQD
ncbi:LysR family transcriptional regulator [Curvibacter sp. RS43]|uniref:LysR family transcriptional regulator n=1 Tax=Curvibacter microcysteis TaxID=3026419 RepID=A0ABT5MFK8_9BURK|nr:MULTISPECIES: LysR family transcriptional regulator [unclassified Curvibacter]MDD0808828.1 LysR family transcriptional regulator [Curvibacter sp. RS43]MDD0815348.1 LysR family transcriptional regulator [Curvibacter sp. HBC28]